MTDDDLKPPSETPPEANASGFMSLLRQPLTKYQSIIGVAAGVITIVATGGSLIGLRGASTPPPGELVAMVQNARSRVPVAGATLEILNAKDAVVTTLEVDKDGRARYSLREGQYRLRVTHPQFLPDVKQVEVQAGQRAEIRLALANRPMPAPPKPIPPKQESDRGLVKFFKDLTK